MLALMLAGLLFIAIHVGIAGTRLRDRAVELVGARVYMVLFALASIASLVWLAAAYKWAEYVPLWGNPEWCKAVAVALMLPAFVLVFTGLTTPNPTAVGQEALVTQAPHGILRVTRHPFLMGVALWAVLHMGANGDMASLLFFGALLIVTVTGARSIDAKRRRTLGPGAWDAFASRTSIVPFVAIVQGRNVFAPSEFTWWGPLAGVVAYALFLGGHAHIIGVSPFPHF